MFHAFCYIGKSLSKAQDKMKEMLSEKYKTGDFISSLSHPDVMIIAEEENYKTDGIKNAISFMNTTSISGAGKSLIILEAQNLGKQAQNRLLKTVEEPPLGGMFLFHISTQDGLLPTLLSRMQDVYVGGVSFQEFKENHSDLVGDELVLSFFGDFDDPPALMDSYFEDILELTSPYFKRSLYFENRYKDLDSFRRILQLLVQMVRYLEIIHDPDILATITEDGVFSEYLKYSEKNGLVERKQKYDTLVSVLTQIQKGNSLSIVREKVLSCF